MQEQAAVGGSRRSSLQASPLPACGARLPLALLLQERVGCRKLLLAASG